jgi:hypothetical protein
MALVCEAERQTVSTRIASRAKPCRKNGGRDAAEYALGIGECLTVERLHLGPNDDLAAFLLEQLGPNHNPLVGPRRQAVVDVEVG